ncbi:PepSY domain-containing protein [Bdellovibrio bacteriovorus]
MRFWRKYHKWISIFITIPFLITIVTGILLLFRGKNTFFSPKFPPATGELQIGLDEILKVAQSVPELKVQELTDIKRIDIRPASGSITIQGKAGDYEVAIDGANGNILGQGVRKTGLLVSLHEGTFWTSGEIGRYVIGLPMGLGVLFLLVSGVVIFAQPWTKKRKLS